MLWYPVRATATHKRPVQDPRISIENDSFERGKN